MTSSAPSSSTHLKISEDEKKRRERVLQDAIASNAIEGLHLSPKRLEQVREIILQYATIDEMVKTQLENNVVRKHISPNPNPKHSNTSR